MEEITYEEFLNNLYQEQESLLYEIDILKKCIDYQEDKETKYCKKLIKNLKKSEEKWLNNAQKISQLISMSKVG